MLVTGIKSKPVYEALRADLGGRFHVMVGTDAGKAALERVQGELRGACAGRDGAGALVEDALARTTVLWLAPTDAAVAPASPPPASSATRRHGDMALLLADLRAVLERSFMGTRLYVAGPESFIGRTLQVARDFNLSRDEIRAEELGSRARRVHCIHCRCVMEDVRTNIVECTGCRRWLLVRDHYSHRLAAYMGVMVDAEAPGARPPLQELYP